MSSCLSKSILSNIDWIILYANDDIIINVKNKPVLQCINKQIICTDTKIDVGIQTDAYMDINRIGNGEFELFDGNSGNNRQNGVINDNNE